MSRVYAAGVQATAISNILSDLEGYLDYDAAGILTVDTQGLANYLRTQFTLISTDGEAVAPADAASVLAAATAADLLSLIQPLNNAIGRNAWTSRADFPTTTNTLSGGTIVAAVKAKQAELKGLSDSIGLYFADLNSRLEQILIGKYDEMGVGSSLPAVVTRQFTTRAVFYTYVTDRDEESAPSPASALAELDQNDTATYTGTAPPGGRNINKIRWYRSRSTNMGAGNAFVAEVSYVSGSPTYTDEKADEELQEPCPTLTWAEPPADLVGLTEGPNGGMGGFIYNGNTACFAENWHGYAWPEEYRKTTAWPIVAMGRFDQTYVCLTRGKPYYATGPDSASLDWKAQDSNQACVAKRSVVSTAIGVFYASPDGICLADAAGVRIISEPWFDRAAWQALTPANIFAIEHEGSYVFHAGSQCYALNMNPPKLTTFDATGTAFYRDMATDTLYIAQGTALKSLFTAGTKRTGTWKTPKAEMQRPANLGWLQVQSDYDGGATVTVKVYRDGTLTDTKSVTSRTPVRLSSKHAVEHEVQVESAVNLQRVVLTSTAEELRSL